MTAQIMGKRDFANLESALAGENGRATARTLTAEECIDYLETYMNYVGISKKALTDTVVTVHGSMEKLPNAYKYPAASTKATFVFDGKTWHLYRAERSRLVQRSGCLHVVAELSGTAKAAIVARFTER